MADPIEQKAEARERKTQVTTEPESLPDLLEALFEDFVREWPSPVAADMAERALKLARELEAKRSEWPPMRPVETAPFEGYFLFATVNGLVHKGLRFRTTLEFRPVESEKMLRPITFHSDQVLGWWPLPEVRR